MAQRNVKLDYAFCLDKILGEAGFGDTWFKETAGQVADLHKQLQERHQAGELGFMDLANQDLDEIQELAGRIASMADNLVVLGIGGSALGATAVDMALKGVLRQSKPAEPGAMRLYVADNSDPRLFGQLLDQLDLSRTVFNVVSKSGSTAETMSQFLVVREILERELGREEALGRLVFTTDPEKGNLRAIASDEPVAILNVPPNVGGRFSVLSPVGLLPLACAGHDVQALLDGAAAMAADCNSGRLMKNPAYLLAALAMGFAGRGTLRRLGQGVKVACEIVMEACDAGLVPEGEEVVALGGTAKGWDTVCLIQAAPSKRFLNLYVSEIVAKPRR